VAPLAAAVAAGLVLLAVAWYFNALVRHRNRTREGFSGIDVQLRRRHDLVPNIVRTVEAYAKHERETLEEVVQARTGAADAQALPDRERREKGLAGALDKLLVLVEAYPDLKADASFRKLHGDLVEVEDNLQYARRYYNATVRDYNTRLEQFPGNLVAGLFAFRPAEFFQHEEE
jgi:LemA protein